MNTSTTEISTRVKRLSRFCSNIYSKDIPNHGCGWAEHHAAASTPHRPCSSPECDHMEPTPIAGDPLAPPDAGGTCYSKYSY